jgi:hypothetical protein
MSFSPLKLTSPPNEHLRVSENEVSGVEHHSMLAKGLDASEAVVQVSTARSSSTVPTPGLDSSSVVKDPTTYHSSGQGSSEGL